jgi:hypothetical protein
MHAPSRSGDHHPGGGQAGNLDNTTHSSRAVLAAGFSESYTVYSLRHERVTCGTYFMSPPPFFYLSSLDVTNIDLQHHQGRCSFH